MSDWAGASRASSTSSYFDSPVEELLDIAPQEKIAAYWHEVGASWRAGTTLARNNLYVINE